MVQLTYCCLLSSLRRPTFDHKARTRPRPLNRQAIFHLENFVYYPLNIYLSTRPLFFLKISHLVSCCSRLADTMDTVDGIRSGSNKYIWTQINNAKPLILVLSLRARNQSNRSCRNLLAATPPATQIDRWHYILTQGYIEDRICLAFSPSCITL